MIIYTAPVSQRKHLIIISLSWLPFKIKNNSELLLGRRGKKGFLQTIWFCLSELRALPPVALRISFPPGQAAPDPSTLPHSSRIDISQQART